MSLNTFVKISNVNNLSDARYCAGMGVDLIGFNTDPGLTGCIEPEKFVEIAEWITGVEFVGEFKTGSFDVIKEAINQYPIQYIQFEHVELANQLNSLETGKIFKIDVVLPIDVEEVIGIVNYLSDKVDYLVLDQLQNFDKENIAHIITEASRKVPVLIGGNLNKINIREIIDKLPVRGINLQGGNEIRPGLKDYDELADILEEIEMEE